jgi:hypothetical protein
MLVSDPNALNKDIKPQNWGTFETEHQRKMGKNVQDTMNEIDKVVAAGKTDDGRKVEAKEGPPKSKLGQDINHFMARNGIKGGEIKSYEVEGGDVSKGVPKTTTTTTVTETHFRIDGPKKEGLITDDKIPKFKPTDSSTANDFLKQYQDKKAAYYKPGAANIKPGGVQ